MGEKRGKREKGRRMGEERERENGGIRGRGDKRRRRMGGNEVEKKEKENR